MRLTKGRRVALELMGVKVCCRSCRYSERREFPRRIICKLQEGAVVHPDAPPCDEYRQPLLPGVPFFEEGEDIDAERRKIFG
jgi:hypothetical protein